MQRFEIDRIVTSSNSRANQYGRTNGRTDPNYRKDSLLKIKNNFTK